MGRPTLERMCPFFIVGDVDRSIAFYGDGLGFATWFRDSDAPFFAVLGRDGAQLFVKSGAVAPTPNPSRDADMRWDACVVTFDPDGLAAEFAGRDIAFRTPLMDTHDGLRGFEVADPDGYVLFFGCPQGDARPPAGGA